MAESRATVAAKKSAGRNAGDVMSSAIEAHRLIEEIVGPVTIGTKLKTVLPKVAAATGLTPRRIRGLWSGEAKAILSEEMDALRRARHEAIHERNVQTLALLARRRAAASGEPEGSAV